MIRPELDESDPAAAEVLLIAQVLVGNHQNFEARALGGIKQLTILPSLPPHFGYGAHVMAGKSMAYLSRDALIKKNLHASSRSIWRNP